MEYNDYIKFLQAATSKERRALERPVYFEDRGVTVATDGYRIHIARGKYAAEPDETLGYPPVFEAMEQYSPAGEPTFKWSVTKDGLEVVRDFLKWVSKSRVQDVYGQGVILTVGEEVSTLETDDGVGKRFSIELPGKFKETLGGRQGEIALNPKYLADALVIDKTIPYHEIWLKVPKVGNPRVMSLQIEYPHLGVEVHILPLKSRRFERRQREAQEAAEKGVGG